MNEEPTCLRRRGADSSASSHGRSFGAHFPGEIADLTNPSRTLEDYSQEVMRCVDTTGVLDAGLKVVIDTAGGTAALVLPTLLGRIGIDVLTVNNRLDESSPTETVAEHMRALERLGELVASSRAAFGVRFDPVGERISLVDERGVIVHDDRALLVLMDLVAAELHTGSIAIPITTTRIAEDVARFHHVTTLWAPTSPDELTKAAGSTEAIFAGDGRGGYVIPEFNTAIDGIAAFVRLIGLVARTKLTLSQIDARIPQAHVLRRSVPTPWAAKGMVMRSVDRSRRRSRARHDRRRSRRRRRRPLGPRAARPRRSHHPPVGGGPRRRLRH